MVTAVLSLRARSVYHQLQREWWRALLMGVGVLWALTTMPLVLWIRQVLWVAEPDLRQTALVLIAAVLLMGWLVVPLLVTGLDDTLEPARFAAWGLSATRLLPGLAAAAATTIPSVFFLVLLVVLASSWMAVGAAVTAVALVGAVLTHAVLVLAARVVVGWAARAFGDRRSRLVAAAVLAAAAATLVVPIWLALRDGLESAVSHELPVVVTWLGHTPVGAGMAAPQALLAGGLWDAVWRLGMMVAAVAVLALAWRDGVAGVLVTPRQRGGGMRRRRDTVLDAWPSSRRSQGRRPSSELRTRAVRSRMLVNWRSDPRYLASAVGVLALPAILLGLAMPVLSLDPVWALAAPVLLAASVGWGRHNDVALDSSAVWQDVSAGSLGQQIMAGRAQAVLIWAGPLVVALVVAVLAWSGRPELAPAVLGASAGVLGVSLGMAAIFSVLMPYRAPAPGANPFSAEVGSAGASLLAQLVSSVATVAVMPLVLAPSIAAVVVGSAWGWVALVTGSGIGITAAVLGVRTAGTLYDHRAGRLLTLVS